MKKKYRYIFYFPVTGSNEKNNNKEKRRKKNFGADPEMGYCPLIIRQARAARRWARRGVARRSGRAAGACRLTDARLGAGGCAAGGRAAGRRAGRATRVLYARSCAA